MTVGHRRDDQDGELDRLRRQYPQWRIWRGRATGDYDLVLAFGQDLLAKRLRPEPGQSGQVVSVNHDVVEPGGHAGSMRGALGRIPETRCSAADGSITGGHVMR
jgi:hypothetical protein